MTKFLLASRHQSNILIVISGPSQQHYKSPVKAVHWGPYLYNHSQE